MKLKINTTRLQELLVRAIKGASNNKLIPLTSLIAIEVKDGVLTITTTDSTNYLYLTEPLEGEDFYVAVQADTFSKLVSKMTSETIELDVTDSCLMVYGNGSYKIDIPLDDDGEPIQFPNPLKDFDGEHVGKVSSACVATILGSVKPSLLTTMEYPWFTAYYVGDSVVGTDTFMISSLGEKILDTPRLISSEVMDLLGLLTGDIEIIADGDKLLFEGENGKVYGIQASGIDNFSIEDINALVNQTYQSSCKISKSAILNLLDRISLFVGTYDNGEITLSFKESGLEVSSRYANETIAYIDTTVTEPFTCKTDISTLITQIRSQVGGVITIEFGLENALKLIDGQLINVVALLE